MTTFAQRSDHLVAAGLTLLRLAVAGQLIVDLNVLCPCPPWGVIPLAALACCCILGLFTRGAAVIGTIGLAFAAAVAAAKVPLCLDAATSCALALSGAGTWSIDALLHGRKTIYIVGADEGGATLD